VTRGNEAELEGAVRSVLEVELEPVLGASLLLAVHVERLATAAPV
jgi:hypothetical protein